VSDIFQYGSTSRELFLLKEIPSKEKIITFSPVSSFFFFSSFSPTQTKKRKRRRKITFLSPLFLSFSSPFFHFIPNPKKLLIKG
jgi:hypothetical protein